jgi:hypothetical protein
MRSLREMVTILGVEGRALAIADVLPPPEQAAAVEFSVCEPGSAGASNLVSGRGCCDVRWGTCCVQGVSHFSEWRGLAWARCLLFPLCCTMETGLLKMKKWVVGRQLASHGKGCGRW